MGFFGLYLYLLVEKTNYKEVLFLSTNNDFLQEVQDILEYSFDNPQLLKQAFIRKSYSAEHPGAYNNEVLEFYGDRALEFVVMKKLSDFYGKITQNGKYASEKTEGQLTEIKKKLVSRKMLAHRMDVLGFSEHLIMGKGDEEQNAANQDSVKEDLFEAILGAVALDGEWDADSLEEVADRMLDIEYYLEHGLDDDENYVDLVQTWCQKKYGYTPEYVFNELNDGYGCILNLFDAFSGFEGKGYSKRDARMNAAEHAYQYLDEKNELILPIDEIGEPCIDRAINQLQELSQKRYIGEVWYDFSESYNEDGAPVWRCECHVEGIDTYWWGNFSSKKQGKKSVAYRMLCYILGWEDIDET